MTDPTGFLAIDRHDRDTRPIAERVRDYREYVLPLLASEVETQATRCMDCGVPFCHTACPVGNFIPDWNLLVSDAHWRAACDRLHRTNNFPEFTGRVCPAPCEAACTLNIDDAAVTIKTIECAIVDKAWQEGWIKPQVAARGTGKRIAIVGSGPAGLACAQQLARMGHAPTTGLPACPSRPRNWRAGPEAARRQPRPTKGILVAITVWNRTLASSGRFAM